MKGGDASEVSRRALANIARSSRMRQVGDRLPASVRIEIGLDAEHDPDAEDWDKVDDDAPTMPGSGPRERKLRGGG